MRKALTSALLGSLTSGAAAVELDLENQPKIPLAQISSFEDKAKLLVGALSTGNFQAANELFFPQEPFARLKAIDNPGHYHKQLTQWYADDLKREFQRFKRPLQFSTFQLGSCKWKEKGSEYNLLPYWSCYKSKIKMLDAKKESVQLEIRTLINFGNEWFITHLGPIPKS